MGVRLGMAVNPADGAVWGASYGTGAVCGAVGRTALLQRVLNVGAAPARDAAVSTRMGTAEIGRTTGPPGHPGAAGLFVGCVLARLT